MRGSREISLVPSLHRASTDALIFGRSVGIYVHPLRACADIRNNMAANPHAEGCGYA